MIGEYHRKENESNTTSNIVNGVPKKYKPISSDLTLKPAKDTVQKL